MDFLDADFADFIVGFIDAIFQMAFQVKTLTCPRCKHLRPVLRLCPSAEQLGHGEALGVFEPQISTGKFGHKSPLTAYEDGKAQKT